MALFCECSRTTQVALKGRFIQTLIEKSFAIQNMIKPVVSIVVCLTTNFVGLGIIVRGNMGHGMVDQVGRSGSGGRPWGKARREGQGGGRDVKYET